MTLLHHLSFFILDPYPAPHSCPLRLERILGSMTEEDTAGPLEAMIRNLQHEIDTKGAESKDLQRRWIMYQTELVALQV